MNLIDRILPNIKSAETIAQQLGIESPNTVIGWRRRNSIPPEYWQRLSENGIATLEELAAAAAQKRESAHE